MSDLSYYKELLAKYGQSHLLRYYDELPSAEQESLLKQLATIDFDMLCKLYERVQKLGAANVDAIGDISPMMCVDSTSMSNDEKRALWNSGIDEIAKGTVAALTMAGGQGTRLGHNGPKGTYDIGLSSHKSLFEIQCDGLKRVAKRAGYYVEWFIMTSSINNDDTESFFAEHDFFGYPKDKVHFFIQTMIPALTQDGKLQLEERGKVLRSPNGNGGLFVSLKESGGMKYMREHNIKYVFVCGIDNCLVRMCDPLFVGAMISSSEHQSASAKSYIKRDPSEKAGIFCYRNGKPGVLEYTEIPKEYAEERNADGSWTYGDTNVLNYIFTIDAAESLADAEIEYHVAVKKLTYLDTLTNKYVTVSDGMKFELFLFDTFMQLDNLQVLRIERTEEFAPVKNPTGIDSAESAREMFIANKTDENRAWEDFI